MNVVFQLDQYQIPDYIPKTGIVAIQSAKGTGKTKAIAAIFFYFFVNLFHFPALFKL
jgi:hypothetical protein